MLTRVPAHACTRTHTCTWSQACALTHASFPLWMCGGPSPLSTQTVGGGGGRVTLDSGREPPAPPASARAPDTCSRGSREGAAHRLGGLSEMSPRGCWRPKQPECPCREVGAHEAGHLVLRGVGTQPRAGLRAPRSASSSGDQARLALSLWEPAVHLCMGVRARVYT